MADVNVSLSVTPEIVSDELCLILQYAIFTFANTSINVFGIIANIINITCFIKQGFKDPINISFLGLSISDLCCVTFPLCSNVCYTPVLKDFDLPVDIQEMQYLIGGWPHLLFARITGWITVLITLERCLCITTPLKVKLIFSPEHVTAIIVTIYIVSIVCVVPMYFALGYGWKFSPDRNRTIIGLISKPNKENIENLSFSLNHMFFPFTTFAIVIICTTVLVRNLHSKANWRKLSVAGDKLTSTRDQKVARMVIIISSLFIACFIPFCFTFAMVLLIPGVAIGGKNKNLVIVAGGLSLVFQSTNSAMNIFIYYRMSSKFRVAFCELFRLGMSIKVSETEMCKKQDSRL